MVKARTGPSRISQYRIRWSTSGKDRKKRAYFTVPDIIADEIPLDQLFDVLLTDEGILYRPVGLEPLLGAPQWVTAAQDERLQEIENGEVLFEHPRNYEAYLEMTRTQREQWVARRNGEEAVAEQTQSEEREE